VTGLSEAYPSNATCTFLNETYCAVDLSSSTSEYIQKCYEVGGRITLFTSTTECNWTSNNGTALFASISNDPVCSASNCSYDKASYYEIDRYEALFNATALGADCFQYVSHRTQFTTLSGMCAVNTLQLRAALPEVIVPYEKCSSKNCTKNYTTDAEVYNRMCRSKGGDVFRQSERMATCQDSTGETVITESNVPLCFSAQCSAEALAEEARFVDQQWTDRIGVDFSTCTITYSNWEAVNATSNGGNNDTSSGVSHFILDGILQGSTILLTMFAMSVGM
jgi:hypothetical protein